MLTNYADIELRIIHMRRPVLLADNTYHRISLNPDETCEKIIAYESFLRRSAYRNTLIKTNEAFFDDSDMGSDYFLLVVFERSTNTPLLSSRYYFDRTLIGKYLKGDQNSERDLFLKEEKFDLNSYETGTIFLADRLSGNISSSTYRKHRSRIFSLFYSELVRVNPNCKLLLMVRKENNQKQLARYFHLGFVSIGSTLHKTKEHEIIFTDFSALK